MSVVNVVAQPRHRCLHVLVDGATYTKDGTLVGLGVKAWPVPTWPGVVTGRGAAIPIMICAQELSWRFQSWDSLVAGIEDALPAIVTQHRVTESVQLIVAGWSAERDTPESYVIETSDELPLGMTQAEADEHRTNGTAFLPAAFELCELPPAVVSPVPTNEEIVAAGWSGWNVDKPPAEVIEHLKQVIQMQRRSRYGELPCYVGGFASLTTVRPDSIEQKVLLRWAVDRIGEKIKPINTCSHSVNLHAE